MASEIRKRLMVVGSRMSDTRSRLRPASASTASAVPARGQPMAMQLEMPQKAAR